MELKNRARQLARPGRVPGQTPAQVIAGGFETQIFSPCGDTMV